MSAGKKIVEPKCVCGQDLSELVVNGDGTWKVREEFCCPNCQGYIWIDEPNNMAGRRAHLEEKPDVDQVEAIGPIGRDLNQPTGGDEFYIVVGMLA